MISLLIVMVAGAAPRGLADAEMVTWAPKASDVQTLLPFFSRAGQGTSLLAPSSWRHEAHPLLEFDVFSPESIAASGIAPTEGLALSVRGPVTVGCHALVDVKAFEAACTERLRRYGTPFRTETNSVVTLGSRDGFNRVQAAVLIKGKESCSVSASGQTVEKLIPEVQKVLTGKPLSGPHLKAANELKGTQAFLFPERPGDAAARLKGWATVSLASKSSEVMVVDARGKGLPLSTLQAGGASPYAALSVPGVATVRARVEPSQLPGLMELFAQFPGGRTLTPAARELAPALTGNVAFAFTRVKVTSGLRSAPARFFATRFVLLAEAKDPAAAQAVIEALDPKALVFKEGTVSFGLSGTTVWLANDPEAKDRALAALGRASGTQKHGAEFDVDPDGLAKALASVPLLEIVQSPELSGVLVAATEIGPLLTMTERIRGWVDSTGPQLHAAQLTWTLEADRPDAGTPPAVP